MNAPLILPGPPTIEWLGVSFHTLSVIFGIGGVGLGHLIAPVPVPVLGARRTAGVLGAGVLLAVAIAIATGQQPLVVLGWGLGIGFSGITIFQTLGRQVSGAMTRLFDALLARATDHRTPKDPDRNDP